MWSRGTIYNVAFMTKTDHEIHKVASREMMGGPDNNMEVQKAASY